MTLASAVGGYRVGDEFLPGERIRSANIECAVADLMGLIRATHERTNTGEYEVRIGIEWTGEERLIIETTDQYGSRFTGTSVPLAQYTPVTMTVNADADEEGFYGQVYELARDCVNQGGISFTMIGAPTHG